MPSVVEEFKCRCIFLGVAFVRLAGQMSVRDSIEHWV